MRAMYVSIVAATALVMTAVSAQAETYAWAGFGGESNAWSNPDNWTNVVDGSPGVPGASDNAVFLRRESAPVSVTMALDSDVSVNNVIFGNNWAGFFLTGAYTLTILTNTPVLWGGNYWGGQATLDCSLSFPNVASGADLRFCNWNSEVTINGDVLFPENTNGFQWAAWGDSAVVLHMNGQLKGYAPAQNWRSFFGHFGEIGIMELAAQHDPVRLLGVRQGTLVLKGNYDAPHGDDNAIGFIPWDTPVIKRIWIVAEDGLAVFSNRWDFSARGRTYGYHEFRVASPTIHAKLLGRLRIDDILAWIVEPGCYVEIVGGPGIEKGDTNETVAVYLTGGGTTDVKVAQIDTFPIAFIVSNGVLLANNTSGYMTHGPVTVCAGGVLGGAGSIAGHVSCESGGIVSPGNSIGALTVSNATLAAGAIIDWDVQGAAADALNVAGTLDISAGTVIVRVHGTCEETDTNVVLSAGTLLGSAANIALEINTNEFMASGIVIQKDQQILVTGLVPVPEPGIAGAAVLAALALQGWKWRRQKCQIS